MRRLSALSLLAALAACGRAPEPILERFPIGMYGVRYSTEIAKVAEHGFDTVVVGGDREGLDELSRTARKHGVNLVAWQSHLPKSGPPSPSWPMDAWYVYDEPDVTKLSSAALAGLLAGAKAWDPRTPAVFVIGQGKAAQTYGGLGDALMLDWYPVPHLPLDSVADEIDKAYWHTGGKPLWFVVQAFDWRDWPQGRGAKAHVGRYPDHEEIRFMSYLAVVHGAKGLFYYTLRRGDGSSLLDWPELWQAPARVAREMKAMQPIWSARRRVKLPFEPRADGLEAACWRWRGRDYLVLLNRSADRMLRVPERLLDKSWRPLFELRRDPKELLIPAQGAHYLPPRRVLVLESRIRWGQLLGSRRP